MNGGRGVSLVLLVVFVCCCAHGQQMGDVRGDSASSAALRAAVTGDIDALRATAARAWDAKSPQAWSIGYLRAQCERDREERMTALEFLSGAAPGNEYRNRAQLALLEDEYYECAVIARRTKFNKFSRVFNRASDALSKLALLQPQDAALLVLDGVYTKKQWKDIESPERRMGWLCRQFLEKYPDSPDAADVKAQLEALTPRLDADYVARQLAAGDVCLANMDFDGARTNFEHAKLVAPTDENVAAALEHLDAAIKGDEVERVKAVSVTAGEKQLDDADIKTVHRAARALATENSGRFGELLNTPCAAADSLAYAAAALTEKKKDHDKALLQLSNITAMWPDTPGALAARAQLMNPDYSLDYAFHMAIKDLEARREEFIKTGNASKDAQTRQAAEAAITMTAGPFAAISMPILFAGDMSIRGIAEMFRTSLDIEMVIDAAARYNNRYPGTVRAREVAADVAELCRKAGDVKRAKRYAELAGGATPKQQEQFMKMDAARALRSAALTGDIGERRELLLHIVRQYPQSKQAKRAAKDLAAISPGTVRGSVCVPTRLLVKDPEMVQMLGIPANMADGARFNGEINKVGVTFAPDGRQIEFLDSSGWHRTEIARESRRPLLTRARELLAADEVKQQSERKLDKKLLPIEISGGIGSGGVDIAPKIIPRNDDADSLKFFGQE